MNQPFQGWDAVARKLRIAASDDLTQLNDGQRASLRAIAKRIPRNGVIVADEVGMGKTRIAAAVAKSVIDAGGRVAILVPPGLGYQWGVELSHAGIEAPLILRSLQQYLQAWESEQSEVQRPWFKEQALLLSHAFSNWRLGENSERWRWSLLPELYAHWRKEVQGRWPREYHDNEMLHDAWVRRAADCVVEAVSDLPKNHLARQRLNEMVDECPWPGALNASDYGRNELLRPWLENAVGVGMGMFDLIVIDEAHKSRGDQSGLSRLLENVVLQHPETRRLGMTATPVELDAQQWDDMLERIEANSAAPCKEAIDKYANAVARVRSCPNDDDVRKSYRVAAKRFQAALSPYLLRRDKREDPYVRQFKERSQKPIGAYRREREVRVETAQLPVEWKRAVCAAEALSFVTRQSDDPIAKRLRLTLGNGHGIAMLLDQLQSDDDHDLPQGMDDALGVAKIQDEDQGVAAKKRQRRAAWWKDVMTQPFARNADALLDHPAILATVNVIEQVCQQGEKVLVFGRFTRPLQALVDLLNAREMLRCLDNKRPWPQSKVHEGTREWAAVKAAHRQLSRPGPLRRRDLDAQLAAQYGRLEQQRRHIRDKLLSSISTGFDKEPTRHHRARELFKAFKEDAQDEHTLMVVARAFQELIGPHIMSATDNDFLAAFIDLIEAASDRDEGHGNEDGEIDASEAAELWGKLRGRVEAEYRPQGNFARLMYGLTAPATRRFLQLAFNRRHSHPKVLVAQSMVGREGLNLHKACRRVVLLHPEWNPGVVEQQIGRVDRIGSLWEHKLQEAMESGAGPDDLPQIEIRPVIFEGTYDEKNWQVLRDRWDDLRAQLHGVVISPRIAASYDESIVHELNAAAPSFSPDEPRTVETSQDAKNVVQAKGVEVGQVL